ncbi:hypothetical protein V8F33_012793 [Rhypophila sp. PSN 637]
MAQYGRGVQRTPTAAEATWRIQTGMSQNYRGDPSNIYNYGVPDLPDNLNTSFWICGLPANITHRESLAGIRRCGRVWALHINNQEVGITRSSAGAKLVFFSALGANHFANRYMTNQTLYFRGMRTHIAHNRDKIPEQQGLPDRSRCLRIRGPINIAHPQRILNFFQGKFEYELDNVMLHYLDNVNQHIDVEIRFGSYRAQAAMAYKVLTTRAPFVNVPNFQVHFAPDPCAVFLG